MRKLLAASIALALLVLAVWFVPRSREAGRAVRTGEAQSTQRASPAELGDVRELPQPANEAPIAGTASASEPVANERKPAPVGSVRGRILDAQGAPAPGKWTVYGESGPQPGGGRTIHALVDATTGEFALDSLLPGRNQLSARSAAGAWINGPVVEVQAGVEVTSDLVYRDETRAEDRSIAVHAYCPRFPAASALAQGSVHLLDADGRSRDATAATQDPLSWRFDDVETGEYTVRIDDPRFEPWSESHVTRGRTVSVQLTGTAAIALTVIDAERGGALASYDARVRYGSDVDGSQNAFQLREPSRDAPTDGVYGGIVPCDFTLIVDAPGYMRCMVDVEHLAARETRAVVARMQSGSVVSGVVLYAGKPVGGVDVRLTRNVEDVRNVTEWRRANDDALATRTDSSGDFEFAHVAAGDYFVRAGRCSGWATRVGPIACPSASEGLRIDLPLGGTLVGRVLAPPGANYEHLSIDLERRFPGRETPERSPYVRDGLTDGLRTDFMGELDAGGAFRFGPVAEERYDVWLSTGEVDLDSVFHSMTHQDGPCVYLGTVAITAAADTEATFDAREHFPGWIELDVSIAGAPDAELTFEARCSPPKPLGRDRVGARSTPGGRVRIGPLPAGAWTLRVRQVDGDWIWKAPEPITIAPASLVSLHYDIDPSDER